MSRFQATRQALNAVDASRSSTSSLDPALSTLSLEDAEVLDAIISKTPEATTFMTVFKAYSEVLQQRGLDPGNDIVYYKQLLKLGVIKGVDWGTKWDIVKNQLGLDLTNITPRRPAGRILPSKLTGLSPLEHEEDVFTLHSHADETETAVDPPHRTGRPIRQPFERGSSSAIDPMESLDLGPEPSMPMAPPSASRPVRQLSAFRSRLAPLLSDISDVMDEPPVRSSTPPPPRFRTDGSRSPTPKPRDLKGKRKEQPPSRISDAEAWKKVEQERQLQDADRFRKESLLSMCFETWRVGLDWVHSTHAQIVDARNHIQVRISFERWRERTATLRHVSDRATQVAHFRTQSATFNLWNEKTRRRRVDTWREEMRSRLAWVRHKKEERIRDDAWTKWRQSYRSRQLYAKNVLIRTFRRWRKKVDRLSTLEYLVDGFEEARERRTLENVMETWSRRVQLHDAETYLVHSAAQRTLTCAFETWVRNAQDNHYANARHALRLVKKVFETWQNAKANKHLLDRRGDKHLRRRDDVLLRAVVRVWVARERGQLLDRVKSTRLMKDAFVVWQQRRHEHRTMWDRALAFSQQGSAILLSLALKTWIRRRSLQQGSFTLADQHYAANLLHSTLLIWRLQLRARLKLARQAKMARKYFAERRAWDKWRLVLEESRRKQIVEKLERERLKQAFFRWLDVIRRRKHQARATQVIQQRIHNHILRNVLQHWTDRVVGLKLREIDTVEQRERDILSSTFLKWKDICLRHVENLSLVNSFQDVKREDTLRRIFLRWLAAARKSKNRRVRLAEHEHELRLESMAAAWEIWRDRFRENRLRDVEYQVIIQNQTNLIYQAFVMWQSRSKSVPGIRFYATSLKNKVWDKWRDAMPLAFQARKARETDAKNVLSTAFKTWTEAHRTKIALKAVARARYLRLPSPGQGASNPVSQSQHPPPLRPLLHRPLHSRTPAPEAESVPSTSRASTPTGNAPFTRRRGLSSLLSSRPASRPTTTEGSSSRPAAPASSVGGEDRRERLWNELRGSRIRDSPGNGRAKSR